MFSVCLLQTILKPENQKELFLKACGQELNLEGIMKEERLCLEISSGRRETDSKVGTRLRGLCLRVIVDEDEQALY